MTTEEIETTEQETEIDADKAAEEEQAYRKEMEAELWNEDESATPDKETEKEEETPVETKTKTETEKVETKPEEEPEEKETPDPMKGIKDTLDNINLRLKQNESRVGSLINELKNPTQTKKDTEVESPSKEQIKESIKSEEAWEELKEDFPEWAEAIEGKLAANNAKITGELSKLQGLEDLKKELSSFKEGFDFEIEKRLVGFYHPGWDETVKTEEFNNWLKEQPEEIKSKVNSNYAKDAIKVLDGFKDYKESSTKETDKPEDKGKTPAEIAAARKSRLSKSQTLKTTHKELPPKSELDMDTKELRNKIGKEVWNE